MLRDELVAQMKTEPYSLSIDASTDTGLTAILCYNHVIHFYYIHERFTDYLVIINDVISITMCTHFS